MLVLKLINKHCPDKLTITPDICLGDGADGQVFSIAGDPNKVIKLCVLYDTYNLDLAYRYHKIHNMISNMIEWRMDAYVRVYEHEYLGIASRKMVEWIGNKQNFILHYYTMEKLNHITEDESKVFHSILSHEDRGINKNYSIDKIEKMLDGMGRGLDFDKKKVKLFCSQVKTTPVIHNDLHVRNIMKDGLGNFKLIDLDRLTFNDLGED